MRCRADTRRADRHVGSAAYRYSGAHACPSADHHAGAFAHGSTAANICSGTYPCP